MKYSLFKYLLLFSLATLHVIKSYTQDSSFVIPLWPNGAPGFENRKDEPEQAKDWWVKNVHNPSLTVFLPPKEKATGAAVLICPGGGHRTLVFNAEGRDPAKFLNSIGVAAIVLKYRLFREENSPYTIENAKQDGLRAMRVIKTRASEWGIDTSRLGVMGFSAGGELVAWVTYEDPLANAKAADPIDRINARPAFQVLIYPGPLGIPATIPAWAPPAFLLAANDDACCSAPIVDLLQKYRLAKVPVEVHLYNKGDHGFNMGNRSNLNSIKTWPSRLADWLKDNGWLGKQ